MSAGRLTVRVAGMLTWDPCVGAGGEAQVTSIETRDQPDAGWLAATVFTFIFKIKTDRKSLCLLTNTALLPFLGTKPKRLEGERSCSALFFIY